MTDFVWNTLVINPQLQDTAYLKQQIGNIIDSQQQDTIEGLLQNIPYSYSKTIAGNKHQINIQVATTRSEEFYSTSNFAQYKPNSILLLIPNIIERQKLLVQNLQRIKQKGLRSISKSVVFRAIIMNEYHQVIDCLRQLLQDSDISIDIISGNYMDDLVQVNMEYALNMRKDMIDHIGEDYAAVYGWIKQEKKGNCSGM